jgi:hypothetical protein
MPQKEQLLELKSTYPRTIQNAAAFLLAQGASTVDAREKDLPMNTMP